MQEELARLNSLLNATVPINALPDELLVEIFSSYRARLKSSDERYPALEWMTILGVCRRWRKLASSTPAFWRLINVYRKPEWLSLCLSRSLRLRTDIYFRDPKFPSYRLPLLASRAAFIRTLSITMANPAWTRQLVNLFSMPMPSLETVDIRTDQDHRREDLDINADRCPRLQSLALLGYFVPRDKALFARLRSLEIESCDWSTVTFDMLLEILGTCGCLERLVLEDV